MICPGCAEDKELTSEFWPRNRSTTSGFAFYCKLCHNQKGHESRERNGGASNYHSRRRYGVTAAEKKQKLAEQDGCCPICGEPIFLGDRTTHIDHDHQTKRFRGVLCSSCNQGLGNFKDDPIRLLAAIVYLKGGE